MSEAAITIRRIAETVVGWGDGWEAQYIPENPDWARLTFDMTTEVDRPFMIELDISRDAGEWYLMAGCRIVAGKDRRWMPVSTSIRKPAVRKAIEFINRELDESA